MTLIKLKHAGLLIGTYALLADLCPVRAASSLAEDQVEEPQILQPRGITWSSRTSKTDRELPAPAAAPAPATSEPHPASYPVEPPRQTIDERIERRPSREQIREQRRIRKMAKIEAEINRKLQEDAGSSDTRDRGQTSITSTRPFTQHENTFQSYRAGRRLYAKALKEQFQRGER